MEGTPEDKQGSSLLFKIIIISIFTHPWEVRGPSGLRESHTDSSLVSTLRSAGFAFFLPLASSGVPLVIECSACVSPHGP